MSVLRYAMKSFIPYYECWIDLSYEIMGFLRRGPVFWEGINFCGGNPH